MSESETTTLDRDTKTGQFTPGNRASAKTRRPRQRTATFRRALLAALTTEDITEIAGVVIREAKSGERWAACEILRLVGARSAEIELEDRLRQVEQVAGGRKR